MTRQWDTELQEWISPGDWRSMASAPTNGRVVLALLPESDIPQPIRFLENIGWAHAWDGYRLRALNAPEFWMPCPQPPTKDQT